MKISYIALVFLLSSSVDGHKHHQVNHYKPSSRTNHHLAQNKGNYDEGAGDGPESPSMEPQDGEAGPAKA